MSSATTGVQRPRENYLSVFVLRIIVQELVVSLRYLGHEGAAVMGSKAREVIVDD